MSIFLSFYSGLVTVLPATAFWTLVSLSAGCEYFWKSYAFVCGIFLAASFALGFFIPALSPIHWKRQPILWLLGQGLLAWLIALLALWVINLTPLCVGQDNGDGNNSVALCAVETVLVSLTCSPMEFILLSLTALPVGWLIKRLDKSELK
jgi:hypothetical protein